jgi:DNA-directed RNA polymerase subunit M/transcription elongation factor TFIIS
MRATYVGLIKEEFERFDEFACLSMTKRQKLANSYEVECWRTNSDLGGYSAEINKLLMHLNAPLMAKIISGVRVYGMTSNDMDPEANRAIYDEIELKRSQKLEENLLYDRKCPRCLHNESVVLIYQSRAGDEMETIKRECKRCFNKY